MPVTMVNLTAIRCPHYAGTFMNVENEKELLTQRNIELIKDDLASMEHPIFSLSRQPDHRLLTYEHNGNTIKIKPSSIGLATILDKDILLYITSSIMKAKNSDQKISKTVRFTSYEYLKATNRSLGGSQYIQLKDGLSRLIGTLIETNIKTNGVEITEEFGIIDRWKIVKEDDDGKPIAIEVKLSDWFYNSILGNAVLSIDNEYFNLSKPTERRLYELARKHCGNQVAWKIGIENLKLKLGTTILTRKLRFNLNQIAKTNHLPEYNVSMDDDVVIFSRKAPPKENKAPVYVTEAAIKKHARPGESKQQVMDRVKKLKQACK